jgi:hypothetical protein
MEQSVHRTGGLALEPVRDGPCQLVRADRARFPGVRPCLHAGQIVWPWFVVASQPRGRFSQGPREVGVADVLARGAHTCAGGCLRPRDQAPRRDAGLPPWEAVEVRACVAPHAAAALSTTGHRWPQVKRSGLVWLGGVAEVALQSTAERLVSGDPGQVDRDVLWSRSIGQAVGDALTGRLGSDLLADVGQVVVRGGMVPMSSECSACAPQVGAAPEQVTGGAHVSGVNRGWREHTPAPQGGHVLRIEPIVCGLAAMEGLHGAGVTQDTGKTLFRTPVGQPGPR